MRLANFIRENNASIISDWEDFAQSLTPASSDMSSVALRDHIVPILAFVAGDIESAQTGPEQIKKSHGEKEKISTPSAAETHAAIRLAGGFNIEQMASEYRALRASVVRLWSSQDIDPPGSDVLDLTRFHEAIDQELMESISHYTTKVDRSKDLLLGILSHDLRTPLGAALMSVQLMGKIGPLNERQTMLNAQATESILRASEIVTNLFDMTRARLGSGLPVSREPMDMGFVSQQVVEEMRAVYPDRIIMLDVSGSVEGEWDKARIGQIFSNLIGNAMQYGFTDRPISVKVEGTTAGVTLSVHNEGVPILPDTVGRIFDSMTRGDSEEQEGAVHLGLGLYITKEIAISHGGTIGVTSSEKAGTAFTVYFPRTVH